MAGQHAPLVVLGATGFIGRHLVARARDAWPSRTVIVTRRSGAFGSEGVDAVQGSLLDTSSIVPRVPANAVFVNLAYAPAAHGDENLALAGAVASLAIAARATALVHISTATVVGRAETDDITEDTPCRPVTAYQRSKLAIEKEIAVGLRSTVPVVTLRPTAVFGSGSLSLRKLAHDLVTRPAAENFLRACLFGVRPMNLVPVETVVESILFFASAASTFSGRTFLVSDDGAPENNFRDVETILREAMHVGGSRVRALRFPPAVLGAAQRLSGRHSLPVAARFSSAAIERAGFLRPVRFRDALLRYARTLAVEELRAAKGPSGS